MGYEVWGMGYGEEGCDDSAGADSADAVATADAVETVAAATAANNAAADQHVLFQLDSIMRLCAYVSICKTPCTSIKYRNIVEYLFIIISYIYTSIMTFYVYKGEVCIYAP
jgi:hypothetical protein